MEIRDLVDSDAADWWQTRLESLQAEPFAFGKAVDEHKATPIETIAGRFRNAAKTTVNLGAFDNGTLVGIATFMRESGEKEQHKGRLYGFYVQSSHRGTGIGRALLARILQTAKQDPSLEQVLLAVATSQTAAVQLYRSFGFEIFGTESRAMKVASAYVDVHHMILLLAPGT